MHKGWREATLGDVFHLERARRDPRRLAPSTPYVGLDQLVPMSPEPSWGAIAANVSSSVTPFQTDDVLFGRLRPYLRKVAMASRPGVCSPEILVLRAAPGATIPGFLHALASSDAIIEWCVKMSAGSRMPRTSASDLAKVPILLPPLDEQRRIVDLIAAVDEVVQAADTVALHARASFEQSLAKTVTGHGQRTVPLGDVAALDLDRVTVKPGDTYQIAGVLNAGQGLLKRDSIDGRATNYAALQRLRTNQLVMRKLTAWEGPITIVTEDFDGFFVSPEFPTFTLDKTRVVPGYVRHLCKSPILWAAMRGESTGSVQRRKRVSPRRLLTIHIPLPTILEQSRCAQRLSAFEAVQEAAAQVHTKAVALRSALLGNLLSGDYEIPASYDEVMG